MLTNLKKNKIVYMLIFSVNYKVLQIAPLEVGYLPCCFTADFTASF